MSGVRITEDDLDSLKVGTVVEVASSFVGRVPYKKTRKGWRTFSPKDGRPNGKPLTSATIAERGVWLPDTI